MAKKDTRDENDGLIDLLQQEAQRTRPAFSESLHTRICRAVGDSGMAELPRPASRSRRLRVGIAVAVAATLAVGAFYLTRPDTDANMVAVPGSTAPGSTGRNTDEQQPNAYPPVPTDVPVNAAVDIGLLVDSTLTNQQWAYLDHDAQLAATMLLDQLPGSIAWPEETP